MGKWIYIAAHFAVTLAGFSSSVRAQIPPSPDEIRNYTGLHAAAAAGNAAEIDALAARGADLNARDAMGRTPLHVAAHLHREEAVRALAKRGADVRALDNQKYDAITIAAVAEDVPMLRLALSIGGNPKAITSPYIGTALIAAAHLGHDEVVRILIAAGSPLDHVNNLGWTALIEAIVLGDGGPRHTACVKALLDAGAKPNLADRGGVTPLTLAKGRGYAQMATLIEKAGGK